MSDIQEEGYIKFSCSWQKEIITIAERHLKEINYWRSEFSRRGYIGATPEGIGFGNLSLRIGQTFQFYITGSGTGSLPRVTNEHVSRVDSYDLRGNSLTCTGLIKASSESLSHGAIYETSKEWSAVIHIHAAELYRRFCGKLPTTDTGAEYGTPEMALEITRILKAMPQESTGLVIMGGHIDGIIAYGRDLSEAGERLLKLELPG